MEQRQAFALLVLGVVLVTAALTWRFGWLGLLVPGAVIALYAFTVDTVSPEKEVEDFE
jgi:hypothetical protein